MEHLDLAVVIPTYDRPALLREALESVFAQTAQPGEVVVVDNGHGDETADMLAREHPGRVTALRMEPAGVQAARNLGISRTTSTWVALLDDDDLWEPTFLETVGQIDQDGRADLVYADHRKFSDTAEGERHYTAATNAELAPPGYWDGVPRAAPGEAWSYVGSFPPERLLRFNGFYASTTVVRRDLLDRIGLFDLALRGNKTEDLEFVARALAHGRLAMIWEPLLLYRVHASNAFANSAEVRTARWAVFEHLHAADAAGSPSMAAALLRDLPAMRASVFDVAFRHQMDDVLARVTPLLRPEDWTPKRRVKRAVLRLPSGVRRRVVRVGGRFTHGQEAERAYARRVLPQPPA